MDENLEQGTADIGTDDGHPGLSEGEHPPSPDTILSAVANEHRRAVIDSLSATAGEKLEYDTLVDHVADRIRNEDAQRTADEHRQRTRIALHHTHLPKLEEARIVDYEANTGRVQFVGGDLEQEILMVVKSYATPQ